MERSPDPPALLPLSWCERPGAPCRSALGVRLEPVLLRAPGEEDRARAACFSARLAQGFRDALEVLMSSSMLSCMISTSFAHTVTWPRLHVLSTHDHFPHLTMLAQIRMHEAAVH